MALRFVNDKAYDQDWYRRIGTQYRDVWMFLWLRIHPVGVWRIEPSLIEMYTDVRPFKLQDFIKACNSGDLLADQQHASDNERVVVLPDRKHLWFVYYVITQHKGGLLHSNPATKTVIKELKELNLLERVKEQYAERNLDVVEELDAVKRDLQRVEDEAFETFWKHYPHKANKADARKQWHTHVGAKNRELLPLILQDIAHRLTIKEWDPSTKDGLHHIVHPNRYLRNRRWEDQKAPTTGQGGALSDQQHNGAFKRRAAQ